MQEQELDFWQEIDQDHRPYEREEVINKDFITKEHDVQLKALVGRGDGFVSKYLDTYSHTTEAPDMILAAGSLMAVSAAIGRHTWLSQGGGTLGLNNFIMPIGPSGSNKSSAMNLARNHIEKISGVITVGPNTTSEALEKLIAGAEGSPIMMFIDEYGSLKAISSKGYGAGIEPLMTEAYGGMITRQIRSKDADEQMQSNRIPCHFNVYACTTPVWLNSALDDIRSGQLTRYMLLFHGNSNKVIYVQPKPNPLNIVKIDEILEKIRWSAEKRYKTGNAEAYMRDDAVQDIGMPWYRGWKEKLKTHPRRDIMESLQKRVDWVARKQAVLMFIADNPEDQPIVTPEYLERAYTIADSILDVYEHKLNSGWLANPDQQAIHIVKNFLGTKKRHATEVELAEACEMTLLNMRTIISAMVKSGIIIEDKEHNIIYYHLPT